MKKILLPLVALIAMTSCYKPIDTQVNPIPGNTLALEFAAPIKFVMELSIDGQPVPIRFVGKNRVLRVEGLSPGVHTFNIHSISYVFGPEFDNFRVTDEQGGYVFVQLRKYRSVLPKNRDRVSIRAYRKKLKRQGIDVKEGVEIGEKGSGKIRAYFSSK